VLRNSKDYIRGHLKLSSLKPRKKTFITGGAVAGRSKDRAPSLDDSNENHDDRDYQQNVNESAQRVRGDHPEKPEDDQQHGDRHQHIRALLGEKLAITIA
jgi:hypothetical protein